MNTSFHNQALQSISKIYTSAKGKGLETSFFAKLDPELKFLSERLNISIESAYLFSLIFTQNMENEQVDYSSLAKYLKCNVIDVMSKIEIFKELSDRKLVAQKKKQARYSQMREEYIITNNIQEAILYNKFPIEKQENKIKSTIDVLELINELAEQCADEEIKPYQLYIKTNELLNDNQILPGIRKLKALKLNDRDKAVFLYVLWSSITGTEVTGMSRTINGFIRESSRRIKYCQKLISGENCLIIKSLIEIEKANFFNDSGLKLANEGIKLLEEEGIKIVEIDKKDIISSDSIRSKQLHYNEKEKQNLNILSKALEADRFQEVQEMLENKDLPIGFNCIFYGPPGTGKTEGVMQLAKTTGRDLMTVDISETKSKWFGDSEKLIKKIFTKYERIRTSQELAPILLFNEADAILSKRTAMSDSNVDQTKNTIQNILLEELENFKGIFIATTNLIANLDNAFERRFLFKIQIDRPGRSAREKIWKQKLEFLSDEHHLELAQRFDFSGGEIENITRKILLHEIINAEKIDFKAILEFCHQEKFENNSGKKIKEEKTTILGFQNHKDENPYLA